MGELSFGDTVLLADPALVPVDPAARARGIQLIKELAPHASRAPIARFSHAALLSIGGVIPVWALWRLAPMNLLGLTDLYRAVHIKGLATSWAAAGPVLGGRALRGPGTIAVLTARLPGPQ